MLLKATRRGNNQTFNFLIFSGEESQVREPDISLIASGKTNNLTTEEKAALIENRRPSKSFQFPAKEYKDKRCKSGVIKRHCKHEWMETFPFLAYSKTQDGLFCICCVLFPAPARQGSRAKNLITAPYRNWKDAQEDFREHSSLEYHKISLARMQAFQETFKNPSSRIDHSISSQTAVTVQRNRKFLKSILAAIRYLGRRGQALRGNRDDGMIGEGDDGNEGNFRELLSLMCETDESLRTHLETCQRTATYISKTTQNDLLDCIKDFIQGEIVNEVKQQEIGPYYGLMADEVTDSANWEQLGIVVRYVKDNKPIERLLEYVKCDNIRGETIAELIITSIRKVGLDTDYCRAQTYDGAGNMAGKQKGAARNFQLKTGNEKATYFHCASHELNLALSKASKVPDVYNMVCLLQSLGVYFTKSAKRQGQFEMDVKGKVEEKEFNTMKKKIKPLCETRWVERHTAFEDLEGLYQFIVPFLDKVSTNEDRNWDPKSVNEGSGLLKQLTTAKFFVAFQVCRYLFGFTKALSLQLQGTDMEICHAYEKVDMIKEELRSIRENSENEFSILFERATNMAAEVGMEPLEMPRTVGRQTLRSNVEADTPEEYWRRTIFVPFIDCQTSQLEDRFQGRNAAAVKAMKLLPSNIHALAPEDEEEILGYFGDDLPSRSSFSQELRLWKRHLSTEETKPSKVADTLQKMKHDGTEKLFPNVFVILRILLIIPATSATVERANSALRYVKNFYRSSMSESRLNALILMYIHRDIKLDFERIIDMYASRHPRRMLFINPLGAD